MHKAICFTLLKICILSIYSAECASSTWRWLYDTSACFTHNENATMSWRVTLNSGESILNVIIKRLADAGSSVNMIDKSGPSSAFANRQMTLSYYKLSSGTDTYEIMFTLVVSSTLDGFGTYRIEANVVSLNGNLGQKATRLQVQGPLHNFVVPSSVTVNEFSNVTLTCSAEGTPPLTLRWTNRLGQTLNQSSVYTLVNVTRGMHGRAYFCNVTDACGRNIAKSTTLVVNYKPENTQLIRVSPTGSTLCLNDDITVTCNASARPPVSRYTFYKYSVQVAAQASGTLTTKVTTTGMFNIKCEPENAVGKGAQASISVSVNVLPFTVQVQANPTRTVKEFATLTLNCRVSGAEPVNAVTTWSKDGKVLTGNTERSLTLSSVLRTDAGVYTCTVNDTTKTCGAVSGSVTIIVQYVSIEKEIKCIAKDANSTVDFAVASIPTASFSCKIGAQSLALEIKQTLLATIVYTAAWSAKQEVTEVACQASNIVGEYNYTYPIKKLGGEQRTMSGSFSLPNEACPPNDETKSRIRNMVNASLDTSCFPEISLTYSCSNLTVGVGLTTTAEIPDPFITLKESLIDNAPLYGFAIDPDSVRLITEPTTPPPTDEDEMSDVTIALIAVAAFCLLFIILILIFCICKRKKKKKETEAPPPPKRFENVEWSLDHHYARNGPHAAQLNKGFEEPPEEMSDEMSSFQPSQSFALASTPPPPYQQDTLPKSRFTYVEDHTDSKPRSEFGLDPGGPAHRVKRQANNMRFPVKGVKAKKELAPGEIFVVSPGPPTIVIQDADIKDTNMRIRWKRPLDDGNSRVIDYKVEVGDLCLEKISSHSIVMPELTPHTTYLVRVYARNDAGYGTPATKAVTTRKTGNPGQNPDAVFGKETYHVEAPWLTGESFT